MTRLFASLLFVLAVPAAVFAASNKQSAPPGSFANAPAQFTQFSSAELTRGFLSLAFGSDLRIGAKPRGIRRFDHPISVGIISEGSIDKRAAMQRVIEDYAKQVPQLNLTIVADSARADIELRLIDEKKFRTALREAFGAKIAKAFVARTDPQCMTSVKSDLDGSVAHSISFIIVDRGENVFLDCAYHELLHAFGLSNHDQRNPWTTLNQRRMVGYLSVYDRALLTLLYNPRIRPGMTPAQAKTALPPLIHELGLATGE